MANVSGVPTRSDMRRRAEVVKEEEEEEEEEGDQEEKLASSLSRCNCRQWATVSRQRPSEH